jgi:DNA invertase Pin-like site-specific DNA recombinase
MTGTKESRPELQRLLSDCRAGKIDLILTKSISRLARNTLTTIQTVRELKSSNIDIYFEKENMHSLGGEDELMLTILASFAEAESFSVSENCKWRIRNKFKQGIPSCATVLGYRLVNSELTIVPEEAAVIRQIFSDYLSGMGRIAIAEKLRKSGIATRSGGQWQESTVYGILRNEIYIGNLTLQKTMVSDHISKKKCINRGKLPRYHVIASHPAIIEHDVFDRVQQQISIRSASNSPLKKVIDQYCFSGKIACACCGKNYRRKIANASSKYAKPVWICSTFNKQGKTSCCSRQIPEGILLSVTADVLGLDLFDTAVFHDKIVKMTAPNLETIEYEFTDGHRESRTWQNKPRSKKILLQAGFGGGKQ